MLFCQKNMSVFSWPDSLSCNLLFHMVTANVEPDITVINGKAVLKCWYADCTHDK